MLMAQYFGSDVRRIGHAMKVYSFTKAIAGDLPEPELGTLLAAAILHDIGIKNAELRHHSSAAEYQQLEGPPVARELLKKVGASAEMTERVCYLIANHHNYDKINGRDFQILVEADFLVNCYEDHLPPVAVRTVKDKYFRTEAGLALISGMYGA